MNQTTDPDRKQIFQHLRDTWIALANESSALSRLSLLGATERIGQIQSRVADEEKIDAIN
jgi:hypothetical protein